MENKMALAFIGLVVIVGIVFAGVLSISKSFTFRKTVDRYKYVTTKDENGNEITKVVDLEDK
jgi:hypothetical protein